MSSAPFTLKYPSWDNKLHVCPWLGALTQAPKDAFQASHVHLGQTQVREEPGWSDMGAGDRPGLEGTHSISTHILFATTVT